MVRRIVTVLAALLVAVVGVVGAPVTARADDTPSEWRVTKYHVVATPAQDGGMTTVVIDLDFDFQNKSGHGPFIVLPERMRIKDDPDRWRDLDTTIVSVTSPSGANVNLATKHESGNVVLKIGTNAKTYTGVQSYRITYRVHGILYPNQPDSKLDEFNWNAVGPGWQVPLNNIKVTVNAPAQPRRTACYLGKKFATPCTAPAPAATMTWTVPHLDREQGLQLVAGFPVGTFTHAAFRTSKRYHPGNMFPLTPATGGGALAVALAAVGGTLALVRRKGADRAYAGVVPGLSAGPDAATTARTRQTTAVAFSPPRGARPGEIGVLMDEKADTQDVTATIVDLAVRKHLLITPIDQDNQQFTLLQGGADDLVDYERNLLGHLFDGSAGEVTTQQLRDKSFADVLTEGKTDLYDRVTQPPLQWFSENPTKSRAKWTALGVVVMLGGLGAAALASLVGWGLLPLGVALAGLVLVFAAQRMATRTATGSAVHEQAKGFRLYLSTAEADQIRFEEGIDVFSKYLPYAIVFGVAERWTRVFEQLAAEGRYVGDTSWYGGAAYYGWGAGFASSFDSLTSSMQSAVDASVAAANSSSSGGSGFGGGGGAGGGGGGGW